MIKFLKITKFKIIPHLEHPRWPGHPDRRRLYKSANCRWTWQLTLTRVGLCPWDTPETSIEISARYNIFPGFFRIDCVEPLQNGKTSQGTIGEPIYVISDHLQRCRCLVSISPHWSPAKEPSSLCKPDTTVQYDVIICATISQRKSYLYVHLTTASAFNWSRASNMARTWTALRV